MIRQTWGRLAKRWGRPSGFPKPSAPITAPELPQEVKDRTLCVILQQALYTLASGGTPNPQELEEALAQGASPNATTDDGEPVLGWLTSQSMDLLSFPKAQTLPRLVGLLNVLLHAGADPNRADPHDRTPLQRAMEPEVVEALALAGARLGPGPDPILNGLDVAAVWREELGQARATVLVDAWHTAHRTYEGQVLRAAVEEAPSPRSAPPRSRL